MSRSHADPSIDAPGLPAPGAPLAEGAPESPYTLLDDRVLVEVHREEAVTPTGIIKTVHAEALEVPQYGTVIATGPGRFEHGQFIAIEVEPGDTVNFGRHAGQKVKIRDRDLLMLRRPDIFGYWRA